MATLKTGWKTSRLTLAALLAILASTSGLKAQGQGSSSDIDVVGTLDVQYEDYNGGARLHHFIHTPGGGRI